VSRLASRPRSWLRHGAQARTAPSLVVVLASSSFVLFAPPKAGPALNHQRLPIIEYTISGMRGTNGWYRGSRGGDYVVLRWAVHDRGAFVIFTSGCNKEIINGPDPGSTRTCVAWSDNGMASVTTKLIKIDADPPRLGEIVVWNSARLVGLRWTASRDAHFLIARSPGKGGVPVSVVYHGARRRFTDRTVKSGVKYEYTLRAFDRAGNFAAKTVRVTPRPPLFAPTSGVRLRAPRSILFVWEAVPEASYYNLQLWLEGERVFSAWPSFARARLVAPWVFAGVSRYLRAVRYTWYVWPARGPRSLGAYRPLLGSSTFVVTR
jgi:hypothetical protein